MAKAIFKALLTLILNIVSILLLPVNQLVAVAFPDFSNWVTTFGLYIRDLETICADWFNYFMYILPDQWIALIYFYITILIAKYTISFTIHMIIKVIEIIKAVKVW